MAGSICFSKTNEYLKIRTIWYVKVCKNQNYFLPTSKKLTDSDFWDREATKNGENDFKFISDNF